MRTCFWILSAGLLLVASACLAGGITIPDAKQQSDNQSVTLSRKAVTYAATNFFYVEEDNRCMGIMVEMTAHGLTVGMRADVTGTMKTNTNRERYILATSAVQTAPPNDTGTIAPVGVNNAALGGTDWQILGTGGQRGATASIGLNDIGSLVKIWGAYRQVDSTTFTVDDAAGLSIRCTVPAGTFLYSGWQYVGVTGISSLYKMNSTIYLPTVLADDVQVWLPVESVSIPGTPSAEATPLGNICYTYSTSGATCSRGDVVEYSFNWGDGTSSAWSTSTSASHFWNALGTYPVTVTARCQAHPSVLATSAGLVVNVATMAVVVKDDFSTIDTSRWTKTEGSPTYGGSLTATDGRLRWSGPNTGQPTLVECYTAQLSSQGENWDLVGDFDIQIDYDTSALYFNNYAILQLQVVDSGGNNASIQISGWYPQINFLVNGTLEAYTRCPGGCFGTTGKLRLTRTGSTVTAYYYSDGWVACTFWPYGNKTTATVSTNNVYVILSGISPGYWQFNFTFDSYADNMPLAR